MQERLSKPSSSMLVPFEYLGNPKLYPLERQDLGIGAIVNTASSMWTLEGQKKKQVVKSRSDNHSSNIQNLIGLFIKLQAPKFPPCIHRWCSKGGIEVSFFSRTCKFCLKTTCWSLRFDFLARCICHGNHHVNVWMYSSGFWHVLFHHAKILKYHVVRLLNLLICHTTNSTILLRRNVPRQMFLPRATFWQCTWGIYTPRGALPASEMHLLHIDADDSALSRFGEDNRTIREMSGRPYL